MDKLLVTASRLKGMWVLGATVLLLLALGAGVAGLFIALPLGVLSGLLGWDDGTVVSWLAVTALVWLPIAVGNMSRQDSFKGIVERANRKLDKYRNG